jgi:hypothetical protein
LGGAGGWEMTLRLIAEIVRLGKLVAELDAYCGVVQRL